MATIRAEGVDDIPAIRVVNRAAFARPAEADLVDLLRARGKLVLSLVAESQGTIVGHIAFSRVALDMRPDLRGVGLAPMAVLPTMQRRSIGSLLVREGLCRCADMKWDFAVVLGHPDYYPRFGFAAASSYGLRCAWDVPDGVFMACELRPGALAAVQGLVAYEPEFNAL